MSNVYVSTSREKLHMTRWVGDQSEELVIVWELQTVQLLGK